jgi:AraC-like DNA-binding protein
VALLLGLHPRALNRRLEREGTCFRTLVDDARFIRAQQLIVNTDLGLGEIGACLGYSEASAFSRAFRRWAGVPPTHWRS